MFHTINGWTKAAMIKAIYEKNNGSKSVIFTKKHQTCVYENTEDNHCAVGCFIPSGHAGLKHKGGVETLLVNYPDLSNHMPLEEGGMALLQARHDNSNRVKDMRIYLEKWINNNVIDSE